MIRVVVAEDSATVRRLLVAILESDPGITVVGEADTGVEAVELATRLRPDLITMDIHMPVMDGLEATKEIMALVPTPILIVSSSLSGRDVEWSLNAIRAGALMVLQKPDDPRSARFDGRRAELVNMAKAMAQVKVVRRRAPKVTPARRTLLPASHAPVRLVAIAASTGGPNALQQILAALPRRFAAPILVVQHIATGFGPGLVDWLAATSDLRVKIAEPGELAVSRTAYLPRDDRHLGIASDGRLVVDESPAIGGFRPSATYLFGSAARAFGPSLAAVILTGMGRDGVDGLRNVKASGGLVLAQSEDSSVVFGMPGEAIAAGVVDFVLAPDEIAVRLTATVGEE